MPTYEYACEACGIHFERKQHFTDEPLRVCPECGGPVHRVLHPVGIIFKGPGFYITDNRSSSSSEIGSPKSKESSTEGKTSTEQKTEKSSSEKTSSDKTAKTMG